MGCVCFPASGQLALVRASARRQRADAPITTQPATSSSLPLLASAPYEAGLSMSCCACCCWVATVVVCVVIIVSTRGAMALTGVDYTRPRARVDEPGRARGRDHAGGSTEHAVRPAAGRWPAALPLRALQLLGLAIARGVIARSLTRCECARSFAPES